jgi:hypothetical protein
VAIYHFSKPSLYFPFLSSEHLGFFEPFRLFFAKKRKSKQAFKKTCYLQRAGNGAVISRNARVK